MSHFYQKMLIFASLLGLTWGTSAYGQSTIVDLEVATALYMDELAKKAVKSKADCKAQRKVIEQFMSTQKKQLREIERMAQQLRENGVDLGQEKRKELQKGEGPLGKSFANLDNVIDENCMQNRMIVVMSVNLAIMSEQEREEIREALQSVNKKTPKKAAPTDGEISEGSSCEGLDPMSAKMICKGRQTLFCSSFTKYKYIIQHTCPEGQVCKKTESGNGAYCSEE